MKTKQRNSYQGTANLSGDEGDLLPSDGHDPIPGVSGVNGDVGEKSPQGYRYSDEIDDEKIKLMYLIMLHHGLHQCRKIYELIWCEMEPDDYNTNRLLVMR